MSIVNYIKAAFIVGLMVAQSGLEAADEENPGGRSWRRPLQQEEDIQCFRAVEAPGIPICDIERERLTPAARIFQVAVCNRGTDIGAANTVGYMCLHKMGCDYSPSGAYEYFNRTQDPYSWNSLGCVLFHGFGLSRSPYGALVWFCKALEVKDNATERGRAILHLHTINDIILNKKREDGVPRHGELLPALPEYLKQKIEAHEPILRAELHLKARQFETRIFDEIMQNIKDPERNLLLLAGEISKVDTFKLGGTLVSLCSVSELSQLVKVLCVLIARTIRPIPEFAREVDIDKYPNADDCFKLGTEIFNRSVAAESDRDKEDRLKNAARYLLSAALRGHSGAQCRYAKMLKSDPIQAVKWLELVTAGAADSDASRAVTAGASDASLAVTDYSVEAANKLAYLLSCDERVERDIPRAIHLLETGVRKNNYDSMNDLALLKLRPEIGDIREAIDLFNRAIAGGNTHAMFNLAMMFCNIGSAFIQKDISRAIDLLVKVVTTPGSEPSPQAHFNLGNIYSDLRKSEDAIINYREAGKQGVPQAYFRAGVINEDLGRIQDAFSDYSRAQEAGIKEAEGPLARCKQKLQQSAPPPPPRK